VTNTLKKLYIIGASGFGREVADTVHAINDISETYEIAGFIDDDESLWGTVINDIPVTGGVDYLSGISADSTKPYAVIAIADPKIKELLAGKLDGRVEWENIIHPTAIVSRYAEIGIGNILQAKSSVGPNVTVGNHCAINASSGLGHDVILRDYVSIMSFCDITGHCVLNERVYAATSVSLVPDITVGRDAFIGAGSVVVRKVKEGERVFGVPAKRIIT
jgi:sugar O-acyltransferase (sialic acid O-acetyltransferase NeuD family)